MIARNLKRIADQLRIDAAEPIIDREAIQLAARRIIMQAEMLHEGLDAERFLTDPALSNASFEREVSDAKKGAK